MRDRSDIDILFRLIKTHAFLHQFNRPIVNTDIVLATLGDYDFAFDLVAPYLEKARLGLVGRATQVWECMKDRESTTSNEISKAIPDITQPRASQILKGFYESGLCTREKLSGYSGYHYHPIEDKDLKSSIKKEIEPQVTPIFIKEWFLAKFKDSQTRIEVHSGEGQRQVISLVGL